MNDLTTKPDSALSRASSGREVQPQLREPRELTTRIERAAYWLSEAVRVDEVMQIRDEFRRLEFAARQAKDRKLVADAIELTLKSERRLGEMLIAAREAGQLRNGPDRRGNGSAGEPLGRVRLAEAGIDKKLSMKAQQLASKAPALFERVIAEARAKIEAGKAIVVNPMKELNTADKQLRRRIREQQLAARQMALPDRVYGVILEDPEWKFEVRSERGLDRAADNHYPTSDLAAIKQRPVAALAAPECVLFMWTTVPMLPQALEVLRFRGFEYKSHFIWDKLDTGTGYWNRNRHELLLVATRGEVPAPAPGTQWPSVIQSRPGRHSEKPDWAYELIEAYFPNLAKIELNARRRRDGWDAWGLEVPDDPSPGADAPPSPQRGEGAQRHPQSAVDADVEAQELIELNSPPGTAPADPPRSGAAPRKDADTAANDAGGVVDPNPAPPVSPELVTYRALVACDTLKGRHSRETARPILEAGYACEPNVPVRQLADDLGHKVNTVLSWIHRSGLSDMARNAANIAGINARRHATAEASP